MPDKVDTLLQEFQQVNHLFPSDGPLKAWKAQGKKVVGWLCIYVPEEIIYAAGALPVRITADSKELSLEKANVYVAESTCSYIRYCLEWGLGGQFNLLDGVAVSICCQGCTRLSEAWSYYIPHIPVLYTLDLPRNITEDVVEFYKDEVLAFKEALENGFSVKITDEALRGAIKVYNESRVLLKQLYELRKQDDPPISGAEILEVVNASHRMPKEEFNQLLKKLLQELRDRKAYPPGPRTRIMLLGSPLNSAEFVKEIENLGFSVVIDELCTGGKYFLSDLVDESPGAEPIEALTRRYVFQFPCPREMPKDIRFKRIIDLAKEYRIKGASSLFIRYCNNAIWSQPELSRELEEIGVPTFVLDMEYASPFTGPLKTRLEAFRETIEGI